MTWKKITAEDWKLCSSCRRRLTEQEANLHGECETCYLRHEDARTEYEQSQLADAAAAAELSRETTVEDDTDEAER